MNIAISGATGYIGKHLSDFFSEEGHRVIPLGKSLFRDYMSGQLIQILSHSDVVINLAGAPIYHKWTPEYKKELYDSRVHVTHQIVRALSDVRRKPRLMISASAVGYYPDQGMVDEYTNTRGEGFLAELCYLWEKEAQRCPPPMRLVITRFGTVLSPDGGAMAEMLRPLKTKIAAVVGPGTQPFPWIDIRDLCRAMEFIIRDESLRGVVNLVAPQEISQFTFVRALAKKYHAWAKVIVPESVFHLMYGDASQFLTTGPHVRPTRMLQAGFHYSSPTVDELLKETDHSTVTELDLDRYMGHWYEIARFNHRFERGLSEVSAIYTKLPDGSIRVENRGVKHRKPYDVCKSVEGHAKLPDPSQPGKLKVAFFLWFYTDYYVLELDQEGYTYALVGSSTDKYLWILSRTPVLPEEIRKKLLAAAERRGYDTSKLIWTEQRSRLTPNNKVDYEVRNQTLPAEEPV